MILEHYLAFWLHPFGMYIRLDALSTIFLSLTVILGACVLIYSIRYVKEDRIRYYPLLILFLLSLSVTFTSADLLSFYIFFEISSFIAYLLIIHSRTRAAFRAGSKYIIMTFLGAASIFLAIILIHRQLGSYKFSALGELEVSGRSGLIRLIYVLFIAGCFIKAGIMPLHTWLPDAHPAAPSPISALLSGVTIKIGLYGIIRFLFSTGSLSRLAVSYSLVGFAAISMLAGAVLALLQDDAKRLLAYSSISQMGYVLLGIGVGTNLSLAGALYHSINHGLFKGLLFLCAGAVIHSTGMRNLSDLGGLRKRMPITGIVCLIGCLAISGVPIFSGFISKTLLSRSVEKFFCLKIVFLLTASGTFASYLKFYLFTFSGALPQGLTRVKEVSWPMLLPMLFLAGFSIFLGLFPDLILSKVILPAIAEISIFSSAVKFDQVNPLSALYPLILGGLIYYLGIRTKLFFIEESPLWQRTGSQFRKVSVDRFYTEVVAMIEKACLLFKNIERFSFNTHLLFVLVFLTGLVMLLYFTPQGILFP